MIVVLGVWTSLGALLGRPTAVALENAALCHQVEQEDDHRVEILSDSSGPINHSTAGRSFGEAHSAEGAQRHESVRPGGAEIRCVLAEP